MPLLADHRERYTCDDVVVPRAEQVPLAAPTVQLFKAPQDDHTRALSAAVPDALS